MMPNKDSRGREEIFFLTMCEQVTLRCRSSSPKTELTSEMFEEQTAQARVKEVRKAITGNEAHVALGEVVTPGTVSQSQLCLFCHRLPPIHVC